jgi:hypothetical protein
MRVSEDGIADYWNGKTWKEVALLFHDLSRRTEKNNKNLTQDGQCADYSGRAV